MKAGKEIDPMGKTPIGSGTSRDLKQNSTDVEETSTSVDPVEETSTGSVVVQNTTTEKGRARDLAAARFGRTGRSMQADLKVLNAVKELPKEEQKVVIDILLKKLKA